MSVDTYSTISLSLVQMTSKLCAWKENNEHSCTLEDEVECWIISCPCLPLFVAAWKDTVPKLVVGYSGQYQYILVVPSAIHHISFHSQYDKESAGRLRHRKCRYSRSLAGDLAFFHCRPRVLWDLQTRGTEFWVLFGTAPWAPCAMVILRTRTESQYMASYEW